MEQAEEEREKAREQAREEKEREQAGERERLKKEEGEEKSESWQRRRRKRPWRVGGDGLWGVPTYPGAWTANLQLPCGSGLMRKTAYSVCGHRAWSSSNSLVMISTGSPSSAMNWWSRATCSSVAV